VAATKWDILGIGIVTVDDLFYVDHYPVPDTKVPAEDEQRQGGGLTATAMVAASRLGSKAAFLAALGDDELSEFTIRELEQQGVDCSAIIRRPEARPYHSIVIVDKTTGERTIIFTGKGVIPTTPQDVTPKLVLNARLLFLDHGFPAAAIRAADIAHSLGVPVVADVEKAEDPLVEQLIDKTDHLIVSYELANNITGKSDPEAMVSAMARTQKACVAITRGDLGCWYSESGGPVHHMPAFKVTVVDTTGCGDVFHGAYAAAISRKSSVKDAIRLASAAAALKATQPGGRAGIPDMATVQQFLGQVKESEA
jgi:sulfofructose kinase